jgi:hypothetical protein
MELEERGEFGEQPLGQVDLDQGVALLNNNFFQSLILRYQRRRLCEDLEFIYDFGGVGNILKTLESGINNGINMSHAR